jgi:hypothetical protein
MTLSATDQNQQNTVNHQHQIQDQEPILCRHCKRTAHNGIKCKGMCVADSDY